MSKVVIERPRSGHYLPSVKTRLRIRRYDPDEEYSEPCFKELFTEGDKVWWIMRKRQCNSKELKAAGLKNDPVAEQTGDGDGIQRTNR